MKKLRRNPIGNEKKWKFIDTVEVFKIVNISFIRWSSK